MFNLDPGKLLIIGVVAILVLGPDKLPEVARQVGGAWRSFNQFRARMESEVRSNLPDLPSTPDIARLAKSPTALLHRLSNVSPDRVSGGERSELADIWDQVEQTHEIDDHSHEPRPVNESLGPMGPPSAPTDSSVDANLN
jgi:sec-independent protein translocase protein TatB